MIGEPGTHKRAAISLAVLLLVYLAVLALGDARAFSGSDAGGKAATARTMADGSTNQPDLGYWAEDVDPDGVHHPIVNTSRRGDQWVQATSVPFSMLTARLWGIGGSAAAVAASIAGGLLAAWSARSLARGLGGTAVASEWCFWLVGLFGPVGFYALDLWEHALAAGATLAAVAVIVAPKGLAQAVAGGLAVGVAVVLRAETTLVIGCIGVAALATGALRRQWFRRPASVAAAGVAAAGVFLANGVLERRYLGADLRGSRASTLASGAGSQIFDRLRDAAIETAGPFADDQALGVVAALILAAGLISGAAILLGRWDPPPSVARAIGALVGAIYLGRLVQGLGFVPGMLAVSPLAAAGLVAGLGRGVDPRRRAIVAGTAASIPLVWVLQWQGNHSAQWGGRYLLSAGAILTVVGVVALAERVGTTGDVWRACAALSILIGVAGLAWHAERTATVARAFDRVEDLAADATLVSLDRNLLREGGAWYVDGRWLNAPDVEAVFGPDGLAESLSLDRIVLLAPVEVEPESLGDVAGFRVEAQGPLEVPGATMRYVVYEQIDP